MTIHQDDTPDTLIKVLAAASFGLGLTEIAAPARMAAWAGLADKPSIVRMIRIFGVRECVSGAGLIAGPPSLVWTRVAGDALDLGSLLVALKGLTGRRRRRCATAAAAIAGITAVDVYAARLT